MSKKNTSWLGLLATAAVALLAWLIVVPGSVAQEVPKANHYKCYQILDWSADRTTTVTLEDQFGKSEAQVLRPHLLCNPVDKNGEGIVDKENHLVCYQVRDDPSGNFQRVREVRVRNQFGDNVLWVGIPSRELCLPSSKRLVD